MTGKTILLVEDEILIAKMELLELEQQGYEVIHAINSENAVKIACDPKIKVDLILMDINLGSGIDGTQAAEEILKCKDIPIVFLSSYTDPEIVEKTEKITSYGYVVKNTGIVVLDASIKMAFKLFEAKQKINSEQDRISTILSGIADTFYSLDKEWRFTMVNPAASRAPFNKPAGEIIGRIIWDLYPNLVGTEIHRHYLDAAKNLSLEHYEALSPLNGRWYEVFMQGWAGGVDVYMRDVSDRRLAVEALRESEEKYRLLHESAGIGIGYYTLEGIVISYNIIAARNMKGVPEDFIGKSIYELFPKNEAEFYLERIRRASAAEEKTVYEDFVTLPSGNKYFLSTFTKIVNSKNELQGIQIISQEITAQRIAEEELKTSKTRLELALSAANAGTWDWDILNNNLVWDDQMYVIYGVQKDDFAGAYEAWLSAIHPDDKARSDEVSLQARNGLCDYDTEFRIILPDKSIRHIKANGLVLRDQNGNPERMIGINFDITARKKVEIELIESRELFSSFIHYSPIYAYIKTVKPDECRVLFASENFIDMTGIKGSDMAGKKMDELFPAEFAKKITEDDWNVVSDGKILKVEENLGDKKYITYKYPIIQDEKTLLAGYTVDITDLKKAEETIKRQLVEKEIILKEVHHRIKNNIAAIESILRIKAGSVSNAEAKSILNEVIGRVGSIKIIYDRLLLSDDYRVTSVKSYLEDLIKSIVNIFPEKEKISVKMDIDDFQLDVKSLFSIGTIVNELMTNSMKYAFVGKKAGMISVKLVKNGKEITLTVSDDGLGLPENFNAAKNSGFGLTIINMFVEGLKGSFIIESRNGTKCELKFEL